MKIREIAFTPCRNFSEFKKWYEKNKGREIYLDEIEGIYNFRAESSTPITNE